MPKTDLMLLGTLVVALGLAGCNKSRTDDTLTDAAPEPAAAMAAVLPTTPPTDTVAAPPPAAGTLTVATAGALGPYLANAAGNALHALEGDADGSKCAGACLEAWPPLLAIGAMPSAGMNLPANLVGTIKRADGSMQVTYNRHPLYRYAADPGAGRTTGHDVTDQWGEWYLLDPQGELIDDGGGT